MESRPPSTESFKLPEGAIFVISSELYGPLYIKIASRVGGRDGSDNGNCRNHFRGAPFSFGSFSFGRAKENEHPSIRRNFSKLPP